jgi:hypothetical protein
MPTHPAMIAISRAWSEEPPLLGRALIVAFVIGAGLVALRVQADTARASPPELDRLIERFDAGARQTEGSVELDAWIESDAEGSAVVIVLAPKGEFKLVADPGITVTPTALPGIEWLVPLPYRLVDTAIPYFTPPASVRLPFRGAAGQPLELLVEYAYCVVDYQCFFGEELLKVSARSG